MKVYGLTGGIATGKSTVVAGLAKLGATVIDADLIARDVVEPGTPTLAKVVEAFGEEILTPDGALDRDTLGAIVFADADKRALLGRITHPAIGAEMMRRLTVCRTHGDPVVILDIPLLLDRPDETLTSSAFSWLDGVIVVTADPKTQRARLIKRDGLSPADADARIAAQRPVAEKAQAADYVIDNSGRIADTLAAADRLWDTLRTCADTGQHERPDLKE